MKTSMTVMKRLTVIMIVGAVSALAPDPIVGQNGYDLFQQALVKERAEGDLQAAIELYQRIVRDFGADRALAARALVQLGLSYEKLDKPEASEVYERVLREYADQPRPMAMATRRLTALHESGMGSSEEEQQGTVFRRVDFEGLGRTAFAQLSPDGQHMVYVHHQDSAPRASVRVRDLATEEERILVPNVAAGRTHAFQWSPDGRKIVYTGKRNELRVIDRSGGESETLWASPDQVSVYPLDWSLDGDRILAVVRSFADWTFRLAILPSAGGTPRFLTSGPIDELGAHGQFSPDGRSIAGSRTVDGNTDVYVWAVDGRRETRITTHPANDNSPFWSPDGRHLVFRSDRTESYDLWATPLLETGVSGTPFRVRANLGHQVRVNDFTSSGQLTMLVAGEGMPADLFMLPVDPATGSALGSFAPFAKYPTQDFAPSWSPDGRRLAYTSRKGEVGWPRIFVGSGNGSEDLEVQVPDHYVTDVDWARDGEHLLFPGFKRDGSVGIFRLALRNHEIEPLHLGGRLGSRFAGAFANLRWLPLANKFMVQKIIDTTGMELYEMDPESYELRQIAERVPTIAWMWPSPDGRRVVYRTREEFALFDLASGTSFSLWNWQGDALHGPAWSSDGRRIAWIDDTGLQTMSVEDGVRRVLVETSASFKLLDPPVWSRDGAWVAYIVRDLSSAEESGDQLWIVPASGGEPRRLALAPATHPGLRLQSWHPSGNMIIAKGNSGGSGGPVYQHWVLENFLPGQVRASRN